MAMDDVPAVEMGGFSGEKRRDLSVSSGDKDIRGCLLDDWGEGWLAEVNKDMPAWKELLAGVTVVDVIVLTARLRCWAEQILEGLMASRKGGTTLHLWIYLLVQLQSNAHDGTKQAHQFCDQSILPWESLTNLPLPWSLILGKEFGQGWWVVYGWAFSVHQCARDKDHLVVSLSGGVSQSKFSTFQSPLQTRKTKPQFVLHVK